MQDVKTSDVKPYLLKWHRDGKTPKTQDATRVLLRAVFRFAVHDGLLTRNPVDALKAIRDDGTPEERDARLSDEQITALSEYLPSAEWRRFLTFILGTAMRGGEATRQTWGRADVLSSRIRVSRQLLSGNYGDPVFDPPKTTSSIRWVPMRPSVAEVLEAHRNAYPVTPAGLVWVTETNAPMGKGVRSDAWRHAAAELALPAAARGWHSIGHTAGSRLLDSGAPITAIAAMLGHTVEELTNTYAHAEVGYTGKLAVMPLEERAYSVRS